MRRDARRIRSPWLLFLVLAAVAALTYLIRVRELTYYKDDWYYIYDAQIAGPEIFRDMFSIDRPARGPFFEAYYKAFGPHPLPYHLSAFGWRLLAAGAAFWLFRSLWPDHLRRAFLASVLFTLYPGYLWWVSAIEYQPMMASLALQVLSIAASLQAAMEGRPGKRLLWLLGALVSGWACLWLVDYAIGMEVFRWGCIFVVLSRGNPRFRLGNPESWKLASTWPNLLVPTVFLVWRVLLFENARPATDISAQLGTVIADPAVTALRWGLQWFQSVLNVSVLAWVIPFDENLFQLRLREIAVALGLAVVAALGILAALHFLTNGSSRAAAHDSERGAAALLGLAGTAFGVLPIVLANRSVSFSLSHYALPASLAASTLAVAFLSYLGSRWLQLVCTGLLVMLAVGTHYSVLVRALDEERAIETFWWQVTWRAPSILAGTTMVVQYPISGIGDDGFGVLEASNLIYFPSGGVGNTGAVSYALSALSPTDENVRQVLVGKLAQETSYRSHTTSFDYGNVLVISQPTVYSCAHVIDGQRPILSANEPGNIILVAAESRIENVTVNTEPAVPPAFAFGHEPKREWCYLFEQADLAAQRGQWREAVALGDQARAMQLTPEDQVEWLPFLEAYAALGDEAGVRDLSTRINIDAFVRVRACLNLTSPGGSWAVMSPSMRALVEERFCRNVNHE